MDIFGAPVINRRELVTPIRNKTTQIDRMLLDPLYNDRRFAGGDMHTIFLARGLVIKETEYGNTVDDLFYVYSDRLYGHYGDKAMKTAREAAKEKVGNYQSAAYFEQMLRNLENDETIKLGHILSGVNVATQYSYRVFGYSTEK